MCGIAGGFGSPDREVINRMLDRFRYRGPDDSGVLELPRVVLGHDRLTIIDLSGGRQPLSNETDSVWLVFNGEIYNYRSLRSMLRRKGHRFETDTDSEVLVHLYEEMGPSMVEMLDGMFAFALFEQNRYMLARDPLGIKPLYTGRNDDGTIYFASEMKALIDTCQDVREFPNGHYSINGAAPQPYYSLNQDAAELVIEPSDAVATLEGKLLAAVDKRMIADVPVGVFLSGGLDSSLIAAMARRRTDGELHSFAVGMPGSEDLRYSKLMADYLGTTHHVYEYSASEVIEALPTVIYHLESHDPALVRSAVPTYFVSRLASQYVKVVLSGEGADELFGGYAYLKDYAPDDLNTELTAITSALHNTNLQRVDRMTMAHSIEGRVPFLDVNVVAYALQLPPELKIPADSPTEKWILRKLAESYLPADVVWRGKEKFAHGTGTGAMLAQWAMDRAGHHKPVPGVSREDTLYREIFRGHFPGVAGLFGRTRSVVQGEIV